MQSCGALERSNNPYIESIVETCVSKNQKGERDPRCVGLIGKNPEKGLRQWKTLAESGICVYMREREKKNNSNSCNHFKVYKKCTSPIQKGF